MKPFWDRESEQAHVRSFVAKAGGGLAVLYGRRRCGKSTLLQRVLNPGTVFFQADQRETALQLRSLAQTLSQVLPEFGRAAYGNWDDLLAAVYARAPAGGLCICLDEFPYLVQSAPALPSILQRYLDRPDGGLKWILCGSSQRMMQGLVLDRTAPLYGRADEILKLEPLSAGWLPRALNLEPAAAVEAYSVWGGVPRYWELASGYADVESALTGLAWDRFGVLHEEPQRLLLDDMRGAVQLYSIMSLMGAGCHRVSEIAGRLEKPMPSLMRPLAQLCELGYVSRDIPFGEKAKDSKRSLYRLRDPFLRFYFKFVLPYESTLAQGVLAEARTAWRGGKVHHVASCWEELSRASVPWLAPGSRWGAASAWWGSAGGPAEFDVVAMSLDGKELLVGECKWSDKTAVFDVVGLAARLCEKARIIPAAKGRRIVPAFWLGGGAVARGTVEHLFRADDVMSALKR